MRSPLGLCICLCMCDHLGHITNSCCHRGPTTGVTVREPEDAENRQTGIKMSSPQTAVGSAKINKGMTKKMRKLSERGGINSASSLAVCVENNVDVAPRVDMECTPGLTRPIAELQDLILSITQAMIATNNASNFKILDWVHVRNKAAIRHLNVLTVANAPEEMFDPNFILPNGYQGGINMKLTERDHAPMDVFDSILHRPPKKQDISSLKDKKRKLETPSPEQPTCVSDDTMDKMWNQEMTVAALQQYILSEEKCKVLGYPARSVSTSAETSHSTVDVSALHLLLHSFGPIPTLEEAKQVIELITSMESIGSATVLPEGYLETLNPILKSTPSTSSAQIPVIAIDCEMCLTNPGMSELTRVTVIDLEGAVLLDEYVKPYHNITNYLTQHSGITPEILKPVHMRLEQIQVALLKLIGSETVVVGHSLENDLHALKLIHNKNCDTSLLYDSHKGINHKPSLKTLAFDFLNGKIIQNSMEGHSSVEDSQTALELAILKAKRGERFGRLHNGETIVNNGSKLYTLISPDVRSVLISDPFSLKRHSTGSSFCHMISEEEFRVLPRMFSELTAGWQFSCTRIGYSKALVTNHQDYRKYSLEEVELLATSSSSSSNSPAAVTQEGDVEMITELMSSMLSLSCKNTMTIVLIQRPLEAMKKQFKQRKACCNIRSSAMWSQAQEKEFMASLKTVHLGRVFISLKT